MTFKEYQKLDVNTTMGWGFVLADWKAERERLIGALETTNRWLKEITTYPVAMQALGRITKDRIEGAIYIAEQALAEKEQI